MSQPNELPDVDIVTACVSVLRDLEQEIQTATNAIACNKLMRLEESLWRQEMLCVRLKRFISTIQRTEWIASLTPIRDEVSRLRNQAQVYGKLVTRSSRSTEILQHLYSLYRNASQHPGRAIYGAISREA